MLANHSRNKGALPGARATAPEAERAVADEACPPLVSCIMPTANRRAFVPRAIDYFLRQSYPHKELVILDDGADSVADLIPDDPCVRYVRAARKQPLGAKRNACVELARGDLIMHWDDDDWHATRRIACQVTALQEAAGEICGMRQMLFHDPAGGHTWLYEYPASRRSWLAGGSLLYTRDFWRRAPFAHLQAGEDTRFVWSQRIQRTVVMPDYTIYVALIHPGNTCPKQTGGAYWSRWPGDIHAVMGADMYEQQTARTAEAPAHLRLNLGCCDALLPGFVNVDLVAAPGVEAADLREPWPWPDSSATHVRAYDIIEHLPDKIHTMNELWRVLAPGGTAEMAVPTTDGTGAFQDPTHVSFWNRRSFLYFEAGNPYRERFAHFYRIQAKFRVVTERTDHTVDGPRLTITLQAVKP
jgi:glycosyltransferase involved in cell wall biosynthesis